MTTVVHWHAQPLQYSVVFSVVLITWTDSDQCFSMKWQQTCSILNLWIKCLGWIFTACPKTIEKMFLNTFCTHKWQIAVWEKPFFWAEWFTMCQSTNPKVCKVWRPTHSQNKILSYENNNQLKFVFLKNKLSCCQNSLALQLCPPPKSPKVLKPYSCSGKHCIMIKKPKTKHIYWNASEFLQICQME